MSEITINPEDEVFSITLVRTDEYCTAYQFFIDSKFPKEDPKHLEQLTIIKEVLDSYIQQAEKAIIHKALTVDRDIRREQLKYSGMKIEKGEMVH